MKRINVRGFLLDPDVDQNLKLTRTVNDIHKRFPSPENEANRNYALEVLQDYVYVESKHILWSGRYARYLDMQDAMNMKLKLGGFVVNDDGYTVTLHKDDKTFRVSKRGRLFFMKLTSKDVLREKLATLVS